MQLITRSLKLLKVLFIVITALSLTPSPALQAEVAEAQVPQEEITGDVLEPFAGAYKEVSQIHTTYEQRIIESKDPTQAGALQEEANQLMAKAVTDRGMTIEDYNTLFQTIQNDPDLKKKFMTVLNQTQ